LPDFAEDSSNGNGQSASSDQAPVRRPQTLGEIRLLLQHLQDHTAEIETYFPGGLPDKAGKIALWKQQLDRAYTYIRLVEQHISLEPQISTQISQSPFIAEAVRALNYMSEYTVKLIGPAGVGKSTVLNAILGRTILPVGHGSAVTGVPIRIRLCQSQELEQLKVQFLSRQAIDELIRETEKEAKGEPSSASGELGPFTRELQRLREAKKALEAEYGQQLDPYVKVFSQSEWNTENGGRRYIEEPPANSNRPYLLRLVDFAEFSLHTDEYSLLPVGSVWVDLPGGAAGQVRHDEILKSELENVDAVIVVTGGTRVGNRNADEIFEAVKEVVLKKSQRSNEVASQMIFVAATHWDRAIATSRDLDRTVEAMNSLLNHLPPNYKAFHAHGPEKRYYFYPLRAFDALFATLGLRNTPLDESFQDLAETYRGHIVSVQSKLENERLTLPPGFSNLVFTSISPEIHKAMRTLSGLPELTSDLQTFLTRQRYEIQLQHATEQLNLAYRQLEDVCWNYLSRQGFSGRDIQKLKQENQRRQNQRRQQRINYLQKRVDDMRLAWKKSLASYDNARKKRHEANMFYQAMKHACDAAIQNVEKCIDAGNFDHYIEVGNFTESQSGDFQWIISRGEDITEVRRKALLSDLRAHFGMFLEQNSADPAEVLASMFLDPIALYEQKGVLDIPSIFAYENSDKVDEIQNEYSQIKEKIRSLAHEVCHYILMGDLIDSEKHQLKHDDSFMKELDSLVKMNDSSVSGPLQQEDDAKIVNDILTKARKVMKQMLQKISDKLAENTYPRIAFLYHYELNKLKERQVVNFFPDMPEQTEKGDFSKLTDRIFAHLVERLDNPLFVQGIDRAYNNIDIDFTAWADFVDQIRTQRKEPATTI
jgi:hypothetical protein